MSDEKDKPGQALPPGVPRANDGTRDAMAHEMNGHKQPDPSEPPLPTIGPDAAAAAAPLNAAQATFVSHCQALLETMVWGTITKFQGLSANVVAIGMCRAMGVIVGTMFHGSLADVLNVRRQCKEAFLAGLASGPSPHQLMQQQQPVGGGDVPWDNTAGSYRQKVKGQ